MQYFNEEAWKVLEELRNYTTSALSRLNTRFHCGAYADSNLVGLFEEFRTEIKIIEHGDYSTFHPSLEYDKLRNIYTLKVPKDRLSSHAEFKKVSYLFRAHADRSIQHLISDPIVRNNLSWEFSDSMRFGSFIRFCHQLSDFRSLKELHDYGLPISQVLGFIARHHSGASLVSLYGLTKTFESNTHYHLKTHRELGRRRPHFSRLAWAHHSGRHDITAPTPQHFLYEDDNGGQTFLVTDPVWAATSRASDQEYTLASVTRTVLWSNNRISRNGFQNRLFDDSLKIRQIH